MIESYRSNPGNQIYLVRVGGKTRRCGTEDEAKYWERKWISDQEREKAPTVKDPKAIDKFLGR